MRRLTVEGNRIYEERLVSSGLFFITYSWERISNPRDLMAPQRNRNYYQAGDYLFGNTYKKIRAAQSFHEFEQNNEPENELLDLMLAALDIDKIQVVTKLSLVSPHGTVWEPFMKISDTELVALTYRRNGRKSQLIYDGNLNTEFRYGLLHNDLRLIVPLSVGAAEVVSLVLTGPARAAGRRLSTALARRYRRRALRYVVQRTGRTARARIIRRVAVNIAAFVTKVCIDTAVHVVQALRLEAHNNNLREMAHSRVHGIDLDRIIQESIRAAVAEQFTGEIVSSITSLIPIPDESIISGAVPRQITTYISRQISTTVLSPLSRSFKALILSMEIPNSPQTFEENLKRNMERVFRAEFNYDQITSIVGDSISSVFDHPASVGI